MPLTRRSVVIVVVGTILSCSGSGGPEQLFPIAFVAESDPGVPLAQVEVLVDGASIGETLADGRLQTTISGPGGKRIRIEHRCPDGYNLPSNPKSFTLREFQSIEASPSTPMEITLKCPPQQRLAVFIVRATNGAGLPVLLDGAIVAKTNSSGVARFSTAGVPGTEYLVELDATGRPRLLPRRPKHLRTLPDANEIFVVNQAFDFRQERRPRRKERARINKIE